MFCKALFSVVGLLTLGTFTAVFGLTTTEYSYDKEGNITSKTVTTSGKLGQDIVWQRVYKWGKCGKYYDWVEVESHFWKKEDGKWHKDGSLPESDPPPGAASAGTAAGAGAAMAAGTGAGAPASKPAKSINPEPVRIQSGGKLVPPKTHSRKHSVLPRKG